MFLCIELITRCKNRRTANFKYRSFYCYQTPRQLTQLKFTKSPMTSSQTVQLTLLQVTHTVPVLFVEAQESSLIQRASNTVTAKTWADGYLSWIQVTHLTMWTMKWPVSTALATSFHTIKVAKDVSIACKNARSNDIMLANKLMLHVQELQNLLFWNYKMVLIDLGLHCNWLGLQIPFTSFLHTSNFSEKFLHIKAYKKISQKEPTRCDRVVEFIIPMFLNCLTCFGRHAAHHQELKNWAITAAGNQNIRKTRGCNYSFWAPDDGWCVAWNMSSN